MFVAVGAVGGAAIVGVIHENHSRYSDYSDYSDHTQHSQHHQYGDAYLLNQIDDKQESIENQEYEIENFREQIEHEYYNRILNLRREKNYSTLFSAEDMSPEAVLSGVKRDMEAEVEESIAAERKQLEAIDNMIAKINEIEMIAGGAK